MLKNNVPFVVDMWRGVFKRQLGPFDDVQGFHILTHFLSASITETGVAKSPTVTVVFSISP